MSTMMRGGAAFIFELRSVRAKTLLRPEGGGEEKKTDTGPGGAKSKMGSRASSEIRRPQKVGAARFGQFSALGGPQRAPGPSKIDPGRKTGPGEGLRTSGDPLGPRIEKIGARGSQGPRSEVRTGFEVRASIVEPCPPPRDPMS